MPRVLFVTGKLAEPSLRRTLADFAPQAGIEYDVAVLPITVVALATISWIARHLQISERYERIVVPGLCLGDLDEMAGLPVERGPTDLRDLPEHFGSRASPRPGYGAYDIAILAEINHAPRLSLNEIQTKAHKAVQEGADIIDLGCDPGATWTNIAGVARALREDGIRVSIDTFNPIEAEQGARAGAELVLSVNHANRDAAKDWGCEVVAIPDAASSLEGLDTTINALQKAGVPFRIDPVLEPIGLGFAASLGRYLEVRRRYPETTMLMGVGNLTELTDVDSAGVNVILLGFCQEIGIHSVLTTEVVNWCRSSVRELDLARRLVHYAHTNQTLPKNLEPDLVLLRDPRLREHGEETLRELSTRITDKNFRLFAEQGLLYALSAGTLVRDSDPFALFAEMHRRTPVDPAHAFYLGYEIAKALTALTLGKNYVQDQALRWGFLTVPEKGHREP